MTTHNHNDEFWFGLITDNLTGNISEGNKRLLNEWLEQNEDNRKVYQEIERAWVAATLPGELKKVNPEVGYQVFRKRTRKRVYGFRRWISYAAVVIPFCILSIFATMYLSGKEEQQEQAITRYIVPYGSKSTVELKDGSKIKLNAGSVLEIDENFAREERRIRLEGEAFIEVAKNPDCPFIVQTRNLEARVLGTTFNVKDYEEDENTSVALVDGSLYVTSQTGNSLLMEPSDFAVIEKTSGLITQDNTLFGNAYIWTDNQLIFNGETFEEIIQLLIRNYNVKINIHRETLRTQRFKGDFANNETIEQVLNVMSSNNKFNYKIRGNTIDIF